MIIYKTWKQRDPITYRVTYICEGWFLFGFIPLYIKKLKQSY